MTGRPGFTQRDRRAIAFGVGAVLLAVLTLRVAPALARRTDYAHASARRAAAEVDRVRRTIADWPLLRDSLAVRKARLLAYGPALVGTGAPGTVAAALGSFVSGAATTAGLDIGTLSLVSDTARGTMFARPTVRGNAQGDISGVAQFLLLLELGPALLTVRELSIAQTDPNAPADRAEVLRVEFVIEGLALRGPLEP